MFKRKPEQASNRVKQPQKERAPKRPSAFKRAVGGLFASLNLPVGGLRLGFVDITQRNLRFLAFLTLVGLAYIWNSHRAERLAREATNLQNEMRELKTEYMTLSADLSTRRQQSQVAQVVDSLRLEPPSKPPYILYVPAGDE